MKNEANSGVSSNNSSPRRSPFKLMTGGHRGRLAQIPIYLGKNFRMFIFQTDWKVLPMSALIAALIALVVGQNMYVTMEGQFQCSLALTCVCIWNGFFNSIQSVCRERAIIKREHRSGMHISSYVIAHLIYQMFLCAMQALIAYFILCDRAPDLSDVSVRHAGPDHSSRLQDRRHKIPHERLHHSLVPA